MGGRSVRVVEASGFPFSVNFDHVYHSTRSTRQEECAGVRNSTTTVWHIMCNVFHPRLKREEVRFSSNISLLL